MDAKAQAAFRQRIEKELEAVDRDIARFEESAAPVSPDKALGRLTRMESLNDQGIANVALGRAREKRFGLEKALERLDDPAFGSCMHCGMPIPVERLVALPESTLCVRCAQ